MANTAGVHPARVMFVDRDLSCMRLRTYGHRWRCGICDTSGVARTKREAWARLSDHKLEAHGSTD